MIDACARGGVDVPHYCYHPGLSAPAQCRQCLVEVEGMPKLMPACVTTVTEGNTILTQSEKSLKAREGTAWAAKILRRIENGWGTEADLDTLLDISDNMAGKTICVLSDAAAAPIVSSVQKFREEYLALIRRGENLVEAKRA